VMMLGGWRDPGSMQRQGRRRRARPRGVQARRPRGPCGMSATPERWDRTYRGSDWFGHPGGRFHDHWVTVHWVRREDARHPELEAVEVRLPGSGEAWLEWSVDEAGWEATRVMGQFDLGEASSVLAALRDALPLLRLETKLKAGRPVGSTNYKDRAELVRSAELDVRRQDTKRTMAAIAWQAGVDVGTLRRWVRRGEVTLMG